MSEKERTRRVAQPPSAVPVAKAARTAYSRTLPHLQRPSQRIFVTFNTWRRWVLPPAARDLVVRHCLHDHGVRYEMHGFVVMPDRVHLVFSPSHDGTGAIYGLAEILSGIKGASAHSINRLLSRSGRVWQDESFDHVLRSHESTRQKIEYICANPARAGLVESEDAYPWLWREWIEGQAAPPLDTTGTAEGGCATLS